MSNSKDRSLRIHVRPPSPRLSVASRSSVMSGRNRTILLLSVLLALYFLLPGRSVPTLPDPSYGRLHETSSSSRYAIATFLTGTSEKDGEDSYYTATRMLTHQILHESNSRCNRTVDFLVLVTPTVTKDKRERLRLDGATVVEAKDVPLSWWIKTGVTRWKDQFTKLRLLEMTEYDRILFIDADTLVLKPLDPIFDELEVTRPVDTLPGRRPGSSEAPLPAQYMFAARSDNALTGERDHPFPPLQTNVFSAGFWIAAPSQELFDHMISVMGHYRRFNPHTMEQSLLNYVFRRDGPMPWREISYKWSATWPSSTDLQGGVVTLHEKFWKTGPTELCDLWKEKKEKMESYYAKNSGP